MTTNRQINRTFIKYDVSYKVKAACLANQKRDACTSMDADVTKLFFNMDVILDIFLLFQHRAVNGSGE